MSLNNYIKFCQCNRMILTTEQMKEGKPCKECQKEHAESLKDRFNELGKEK